MKQETLEALRGSIKKWEAIVDGTGVDDASDNCPLCGLFNPAWGCETRGGEICPVAVASGSLWCAMTPYEDWRAAATARAWPDSADYPIHATDDETVMCAVLELEFLKSLLPTDKT